MKADGKEPHPPVRPLGRDEMNLVGRQSSFDRRRSLLFLEGAGNGLALKHRRPAMDKYRVTLTAEERVELKRLVAAGKAAARKLTHARILLLADATDGDERPDEEIVEALGTSPRTITRIRQRFVTEGIQAALDRSPQPPRPDKIKIKADVEQRLVQLACSDPPQGRCHWTLQLLADELVVLGLAEAISTETVRQSLKKTTSRPGSLRLGACPPTLTPSSSGGWRT